MKKGLVCILSTALLLSGTGISSVFASNEKIIREDAVSVTMSSSENARDAAWFKSPFDLTNKNSAKEALDLVTNEQADITTINLDEEKSYQELLGLGSSIEGSTVQNLIKMDKTTRQSMIRAMIDPINGAGMTLFRLTVASSDFTAGPFYSYYDNAPVGDQRDWDNTTGKGFSIEKDKELISVIHEIQEIAKELGVEEDIQFFSSPWSPPGWMKDLNTPKVKAIENSEVFILEARGMEVPVTLSWAQGNNDLDLCGGFLKDEAIDDLAKYYTRYLEEYQKQGISISALTLQNEPKMEQNFPSCLVTPKQEAALALALSKEIAASTILNQENKQVKLWAYDYNPDGVTEYMEQMKAYEGYNEIDGIACHDYNGDLSMMKDMEEIHQGKSIHLTERSVWGSEGMDRIIQYFRNGAKSYNAWVTMLNSKMETHYYGKGYTLMIDPSNPMPIPMNPDPTLFIQDAVSSNNYWATPEVYLNGQFSKYIRPGDVRIDTDYGSKETITNVAFKNPETGIISLVAVNQTTQDQTFKVVQDGAAFTATLPAGNAATYQWNSDIVAPVIEGHDATVIKGNTSNIDSLLDLNIHDDKDQNIPLDSANVKMTTDFDATKAGKYQAKVDAYDKAGNHASRIFNILVEEPIVNPTNDKKPPVKNVETSDTTSIFIPLFWTLGALGLSLIIYKKKIVH